MIFTGCATVKESIPFFRTDTTLTVKHFWKTHEVVVSQPHSVSGKGFFQVDTPEMSGKVRAEYKFSSRGVLRMTISTLLTGKLADVWMHRDSVVVNDYLNRQSFMDVLNKFDIPGLGKLSIGDWNLTTMFLGLVKFDRKEWIFIGDSTGYFLKRASELVKLDDRGRIRNWQVQDAESGQVMRKLELDYNASNAIFPVMITITDFIGRRKLKLIHHQVVWDDPNFTVKSVRPLFQDGFKFSKGNE